MLSQGDEDLLHRVISAPLRDACKFGKVDLSRAKINTRKVDLGDKMHLRRLVRIPVAAVDLEAVDAVLVGAVRRTEDGSIPVGHHDIVAISETVGTAIGTQAFLALFKLFE